MDVSVDNSFLLHMQEKIANIISIAWSAPGAIMTGGMGFGGQVGK